VRDYRVRVAPAAEKALAALHPDVKRAIRSALDTIASKPESGLPLAGELSGLHRYKVRRFRIVYEIVASERVIRVMAVGHRRDIYDELVGRRES
jgi:mRNA interferase RelE/StbE